MSHLEHPISSTAQMHHQTVSSASLPPTPTISSQLKREEQRIDLKVLHHLNKDDNRKKQKRFARTVLAVHTIVSKKLYKTKANSLEAYFRDAWKISRAQVYRFLDCAVILKQLESFPKQPCRERLCRSLKRVAKNRADIHTLWSAVLERVNNEHESVTSTIINNVWRELLEAKLVTGNQPSRDEKVEIMAEVGDLTDLEMDVADDNACDSDAEGTVKSVPKPLPNEQRQQQQQQQGREKQETYQQHQRPQPQPPPQSQQQQQDQGRQNSLFSESVPAGSSSKPLSAFSSHTYRPSHLLRNPEPREPYFASRQSSATSTSFAGSMMQHQQNGSSLPSGENQIDKLSSSSAAPRWSDPLAAGGTFRAENGETPDSATANEITTCLSLVHSLARKGFAVQPYMNGRWSRAYISQLRVVPVSEAAYAETSQCTPNAVSGAATDTVSTGPTGSSNRNPEFLAARFPWQHPSEETRRHNHSLGMQLNSREDPSSSPQQTDGSSALQAGTVMYPGIPIHPSDPITAGLSQQSSVAYERPYPAWGRLPASRSATNPASSSIQYPDPPSYYDRFPSSSSTYNASPLATSSVAPPPFNLSSYPPLQTHALPPPLALRPVSLQPNDNHHQHQLPQQQEEDRIKSPTSFSSPQDESFYAHQSTSYSHGKHHAHPTGSSSHSQTQSMERQQPQQTYPRSAMYSDARTGEGMNGTGSSDNHSRNGSAPQNATALGSRMQNRVPPAQQQQQEQSFGRFYNSTAILLDPAPHQRQQHPVGSPRSYFKES
ncbi:hypothetical protein DFJ77DRAFT_466620 [Powellomyces hirtus]|nr:hypothetical protein DFJ77DRAFT_466620 [Powellomyces hirtus]